MEYEHTKWSIGNKMEYTYNWYLTVSHNTSVPAEPKLAGEETKADVTSQPPDTQDTEVPIWLLAIITVILSGFIFMLVVICICIAKNQWKPKSR